MTVRGSRGQLHRRARAGRAALAGRARPRGARAAATRTWRRSAPRARRWSSEQLERALELRPTWSRSCAAPTTCSFDTRPDARRLRRAARAHVRAPAARAAGRGDRDGHLSRTSRASSTCARARARAWRRAWSCFNAAARRVARATAWCCSRASTTRPPNERETFARGRLPPLRRRATAGRRASSCARSKALRGSAQRDAAATAHRGRGRQGSRRPLRGATSTRSPLGDRFVDRAARTIGEADIIAFATLTGDTHPQHTDAEWAAGSRFGEQIAHGLLVLSYAAGLMPFDPERIVALRRVGDAVFKQPVKIGDTLHVEGEIVRTRELDAEHGLVEARWRIVNQRGRLVVRADVELVWRRDAARGRRRARARPDLMLAGKRLLITGVLTKGSIAYSVAERAQQQGARDRAHRLRAHAPDDRARGGASARSAGRARARREQPRGLRGAASASSRQRWGGLDGALHAIAFAPGDALGGNFMSAPPESAELAFRTSAYSFKALAEARRAADGRRRQPRRAWTSTPRSPGRSTTGWAWRRRRSSRSRATWPATSASTSIRVNLISAGPVETPGRPGHPGLRRRSRASGESRHRWAGTAATRRPWPTPCSSCCRTSSRAVTGEILHVDGGFHAMGAPLRP